MHFHILAEVDDSASNIEESLILVQATVNKGYIQVA